MLPWNPGLRAPGRGRRRRGRAYRDHRDSESVGRNRRCDPSPCFDGGLSWYGRARINSLAEAPDGSGRIFVNDLNGPFYIVDVSNGNALHTYLDMLGLRPDLKRMPGLASGFVSFAFHPDFAINGLLYTVHSEFIGEIPPNLVPGAAPTSAYVHHSVLTEWTASDPAANLFAGTSRELIRIPAAHHSHNMGVLAFDPNVTSDSPEYGFLYVPSGDFGAGVKIGEPELLQRLDSPYGAMLRIDPLGGPFTRGGMNFHYGIPGTNPHVSSTDPATLAEIFAHGLRNGHRLVFDRGGAGTTLLIDIGEKNVEEINVLEAGANYGWPDREGTFDIDVSVESAVVSPLPASDPVPYEYPAAQYDHGDGLAIAGAEIVRIPANSVLAGHAIVGDLVSGRLMHTNLAELVAANDGDPATTSSLHDLEVLYQGQTTSLIEIVRAASGNPGLSRVDLRLHSDLSGQIWITTKQDGWLRKVVPIGEAAAVPSLGQYGLAILGAVVVALGFGTVRRRRSTVPSFRMCSVFR
jgi:glucose/arabinose dehydrogenase